MGASRVARRLFAPQRYLGLRSLLPNCGSVSASATTVINVSWLPFQMARRS